MLSANALSAAARAGGIWLALSGSGGGAERGGRELAGPDVELSNAGSWGMSTFMAAHPLA